MNKATAKRKMTAPRGIGHCTIGCDAWYYVNDKTIDVLIRKEGEGTLSARLTRRQLEQALDIMRAASGESGE